MKQHPFTRTLAALLALVMLLGLAPAPVARAAEDGIVLADQVKAAPIYIDRDGADYDGISLIAIAAAKDVGAVTGTTPKVCAVATQDTAQNAVLEPEIKDNVVSALGNEDVIIIAGTLEDKLIRDLGQSWSITPSGESFKAPDFERYEIKVLRSGSQTRIVVAGADKRGTIYGLFHITQDLAGVSPWIWWADVVPLHRDVLRFTEQELTTVSRRPSVNYRGFFFNDENPNLDGFADSHYGGLNYLFYNEVFELMLRLKGNYLWPAMWSNSFNSDGVEGMCAEGESYAKLKTGNEFARMEAEHHYLLGGAMYVDQPGNESAACNAPNTNTTNLTAEQSAALAPGSRAPIGPGQYPMILANAVLADRYGVLIGASHHEPMSRAGVEWQNLQGRSTYNQATVNNTSKSAWNYLTNPTNISNFWADGIGRNGSFDNLLTIGMRGENDTALTDANGRELSTAQNAALLKDVIREQDRLLRVYGLENSPQLIALYKEVENCWYGGSRDNPDNANRSAALVFDDEITELLGADTNRIVMFCEDNNGYLRTLGEYGEKDRFNYGLYYHFDFVGSPHTSMWTNTMPLQRSWDNLTTAYEYGVDDAWMFNVGDLKPMELPLSYVMEMAYDFDTYGTNAAEDTDQTITWEEFTVNWVKQQFAAKTDLTEDDYAALAKILTDYTHLNGNRKPEQQQFDTYSLTSYNEAQRILAFAKQLETSCNQYLARFQGTPLYDAYYQLIYYTGVESATVNQVLIYQGLNRFYSGSGSALANVYADKVNQMLANDRGYTEVYNQLGPQLNGKNKWYRMMLASPFNNEKVCGLTALGHLNYSGWNRDSAQPFSPTYVTLAETGQLRADVTGCSAPVSSGSLTLPDFDSTQMQSWALTLSNTGESALDYEITGLPQWLILDGETKGKVYVGKTIPVRVDWSKLTADAKGSFKVVCGSQSITVNANAKLQQIPDEAPDGTAFLSGSQFSFIATNYSDMGTGRSKAGDGKTVGWVSMPGYGKTEGSMKPFPVYTDDCAAGEGPWLDYKVWVPAGQGGSYQLNIFFGQSDDLSFYEGKELNFAIQLNGGAIQTKNALQNNYVAGSNSNGPWSNNIKECGHVMNYGSLTLQEGLNTLRIYAMDQNMLLQKVILSKGSGAFKSSYTGAPQSWRKGDPAPAQQAMIHDAYNDHEHDYETAVTQPTCTEGGYTDRVCKICGKVDRTDLTKALGHQWGKDEILQPATETAAGLKKQTCERCGATRTVKIPRVGSTVPEDIDFTDPDSTDQFELRNPASSAIVPGTGLPLVTTRPAFEDCKEQNTGAQATTPEDVVVVPVEDDWTATLTVQFDTNGAGNGYYQFFGFYAMQGDDYQNLAGIRGGDKAMQNFQRENGTITHQDEDGVVSSPGFDTSGKTYYLRIEKQNDTYICSRSDDGETFAEMFAYETTGMEANYLVIDAYTGMTTGYKFTLKSLTFEAPAGPVIPAPDKTALEAAIQQAEAVKKDEYTEETVKALDDALAAAKKALDEAKTQDELDAAAKVLTDAIAALEKKPQLDKTELEKAIEEAEQVEKDPYTEASVKALDDALAAAKKALTDAKTQDELDAAAKALNDAIKGLEKKPEDPGLKKDALEKAIEDAEKIEKDKYTDQTVKALEEAIAAAKKALEEAKTQEELDAAKKVLDDAIKALVSAPTPHVCPGAKFTDMPAEGYWSHSSIDWAIVNGITQGTSETTFGPTEGCTRAQVVTFLWRAAKQPEPTATNNPFTDVKESDYFYKAVLWAVEKGITLGTEADKFSPGATCTRAQIVTFLYRYEGKPATEPDDSFTDVKPTDYFADSVAWAVKNGITQGTDPGKFSPSDTCTREQVVTFLYRDVEK